MQKRVAAIHDISCFGRCSLTVALPILSAGGYETSIIPTAVLSTHTGGFEGFTFRDLTEDILPIAEHWKTLDISFDAIYTGYLGSFAQLDMVSQIFDMYKKKETLIVVDPVMGDNGRLYTSFKEDFPIGMAGLCKKADIIVPNITEAALLVQEQYLEGPYTPEYIEKLLKKMADFGAKKVVLTGVYFEEGQIGAAAYDSTCRQTVYSLGEKVPGMYHGTGDVFSSVLLTGLLSGFSMEEALKLSVDFTAGAINRTYKAGTDNRFGVNFEEGLYELAKVCSENRKI